MLIDAFLLLSCLASIAMSAILAIKYMAATKRIGFLGTANDRSLHTLSPSMCVVIPARNEAADIANTVHSLLAQQNVWLQIIVVNDHSTDETAGILDRLAAAQPRLQVVHDPPLRSGWFGKANAMQHGLEQVHAELVLFADADIRFHPECLIIALAEFQRRQLDFLSMLPRFECTTFWENTYMPHSFIGGCAKFLTAGINQQGSPDGAAAGAFMLARTDVLRALGGLSVVKQEMLDDVCLARAIKRAGYRGELRFAPELLSVEMFKTNRQAFWGTTKNILAAVDQLWNAVPVMFLPLAMYWLPLAAIIYGALIGTWWLAALGGLVYLFQVGLLWLVLPVSRLRWPYPLLFPLACLPIMCCMTLALYQRLRHRSVLWRGRQLQVNDAAAK